MQGCFQQLSPTNPFCPGISTLRIIQRCCPEKLHGELNPETPAMRQHVTTLAVSAGEAPASAKHLWNSGTGPYGLCGASIDLSRLSTRDKFSPAHSLTSFPSSTFMAGGCVRRAPTAAGLWLQHFVMGTSNCATPGARGWKWVLITPIPMGAMSIICSHGKARQRKAGQGQESQGKERQGKASSLSFVQSGNIGLKGTSEIIDVSDSEMSFILLFSLLMTDLGLWAVNQQPHVKVRKCQVQILMFPRHLPTGTSLLGLGEGWSRQWARASQQDFHLPALLKVLPSFLQGPPGGLVAVVVSLWCWKGAARYHQHMWGKHMYLTSSLMETMLSKSETWLFPHEL